MKCYLLAKIGANDEYTPQAICATEDAAKVAAIDGAYLIVPVTVGELYDTLLDTGLPGAVVYDKEGLATLIAKARQAISDLHSDVQDLVADLSTLNANFTAFQTSTNDRFQQAQNALATINNKISAIDARVTALENG